MKAFSYLLIILITVVLSGCNENRSISYYSYKYNPSYTGELSQIGFIKDVSDPDAHAQISDQDIPEKCKIMVIQSGQAYPDSELMKSFSSSTSIVGISGNPEIGNIDRISLRQAAKSGNINFILGVWGTIRNTHDGHIFIILSAVLANVQSGTWKYIEVASKPTDKAWTFFDPQGADDLQVQQLKTEVYSYLIKSIFGSNANQGATPEPAIPIR